MGLPNPSREETKFSGAKVDREILVPCSADHMQDWQPYPVDPYSCYMYVWPYIRSGYNVRVNIPKDAVRTSALDMCCVETFRYTLNTIIAS